METQTRGQLTQRIKDKSLELLGYEITLRQLRLIPYLIYTMVNSQRIDDKRINDEEFEMILDWETQGHLTYDFTGNGKLSMSKEFWDISNEIIYLGYVDLNKEQSEV